MKSTLPVALALLLGCAASTTQTPTPPAPSAPASASSATAAAARPFGSRRHKCPVGSIRPSGGQGALVAEVKAAYDRRKAAYVTTGCGGHYVKGAGEPGQVTSSPANAAGMIIPAFMAGHDPEAQKIFDGILTVS